MKYSNLIKLNDMIINSYSNNKNHYCCINNVNNDIKFMEKYNNELPSMVIKGINKKYNLNINEERIDIINKNISNEGLKNIISKINKEKIFKLYINSSIINNLDFLGNYNFCQLRNLSLISCNINDIKNLNNIKCPRLKELDLADNYIKDINVLKACNFDEIETK